MMAKKPSLEMVLGTAKPDDSAEMDESSGEYSEDQQAMATELIDAMKAGDATQVLDAIHGIYRSYSMESEEPTGGAY